MNRGREGECCLCSQPPPPADIKRRLRGKIACPPPQLFLLCSKDLVISPSLSPLPSQSLSLSLSRLRGEIKKMESVGVPTSVMLRRKSTATERAATMKEDPEKWGNKGVRESWMIQPAGRRTYDIQSYFGLENMMISKIRW